MSLVRLFRAAAFLSFGLTSAQSQVPNVQGHVFDSRGKPVVDATASIGAAGRSSRPTDSNGFFSIEPAPSVKVGDPVTLKITKIRFRMYTKHMGYTGDSQVVTLIAENPSHDPAPTRPQAQPGGQTQPPGVVTNPLAQQPAPLWSKTDDQYIDSVQDSLNSLPSNATDAQTTSVLRGLFDAPVFSSIGEERAEDALYRFCRTERILIHYQLRFNAPEVRTAASTASQNLIHLQDIFADLYGQTFSAKEQCNRYGARSRSEYQANLPQRLKAENLLSKEKAQEIIDKMLTTLYSVGLSLHAPPALPQPPPSGDSAVGANPPATTVVVQIDSARFNDWLDQGNKGGNQYWLKSVWLSIDTDERQIAKNLAFDAEVPQVDQSFILTKGRHKFRFRLEFDVRHLMTHERYTTDRLGDFEVDKNTVLTPFLTVKAGEITQRLLLKQSDPIPDRTAP